MLDRTKYAAALDLRRKHPWDWDGNFRLMGVEWECPKAFLEFVPFRNNEPTGLYRDGVLEVLGQAFV